MGVSRRAGEEAQGGWSSRRNRSISAYRHELACGLGESLIPLQYLDEMIDVLAAVAGIKVDANACGPHRHGPKRDPIDIDPFFANCPSEPPPFRLRTHPDRHTSCLVRYEVLC